MRWKFLHRQGSELVSGLGRDGVRTVWKIGEWQKVNKPVQECVGLNCSAYIPDAIQYVKGDVLALVECAGKVVKSSDKETWEKMRIIKIYEWTKERSVNLAIQAARLVLDIFESAYPEDKRPREAIEAAERRLAEPTEANIAAADAAANAAYAAYAAERKKVMRRLHGMIIAKLEE